MSTTSIAQKAINVGAALKQIDNDLPQPVSVYICDGFVSLHLESRFRLPDKARVVAEWATHMGVPVRIDMTHSGELNTVFELGGHDVTAERPITHAECYELGRRLRREVSPGGVVEVDAAELMALFPVEVSS